MSPKNRASEQCCSVKDLSATGKQSHVDQFWELVYEHQDRAIAIATHLTGDREMAKDVAQEAFFRAFKALPSFRGDSKISTWFFRILVNQAKNHKRHLAIVKHWRKLLKTSDKVEFDFVHGSPEPRPDKNIEHSAVRNSIGQALAKLSTNQRTAFSLVHIEGMTTAEAAQIMQMAPGTIKSHLHRALSKLRKELAHLVEDRS